jgi:hypothetical protein
MITARHVVEDVADGLTVLHEKLKEGREVLSARDVVIVPATTRADVSVVIVTADMPAMRSGLRTLALSMQRVAEDDEIAAQHFVVACGFPLQTVDRTTGMAEALLYMTKVKGSDARELSLHWDHAYPSLELKVNLRVGKGMSGGPVWRFDRPVHGDDYEYVRWNADAPTSQIVGVCTRATSGRAQLAARARTWRGWLVDELSRW